MRTHARNKRMPTQSTTAPLPSPPLGPTYRCPPTPRTPLPPLPRAPAPTPPPIHTAASLTADGLSMSKPAAAASPPQLSFVVDQHAAHAGAGAGSLARSARSNLGLLVTSVRSTLNQVLAQRAALEA